MAFKMKNSSIAKLAKNAGSPIKKNKPTYEEAWNNMKSYESEGRKFKDNMARGGTVYFDDEGEFGKARFINQAKLYNAKQKNKNVKRIEPKKVKSITNVTTRPTLEKQEPYVKPSQKDIKKAKRKALIGKIFGDGSKRKANEERKKKNLSKSVTGRIKLRSEKFRRR
jgi:hypothetical protein